MINDIGVDLTLENLPELLDLLTYLLDDFTRYCSAFNYDKYINCSLEDALKLVFMGEYLGRKFPTFSGIRSFINTASLQPNLLTAAQQKQLLECERRLTLVEIKANEMRSIIHHAKKNLDNAFALENFVREKILTAFDPHEFFSQPEKNIFEYEQFLREKVAAVATDTSSYYTPKTSAKSYQITDKMHSDYAKLGKLLPELYRRILFSEPILEIQDLGTKLGIQEKNAIFIETRFEESVLLDLCFFQYRIADKNFPERFYEKYQQQLHPELLQLLLHYKEARFSVLDLIKPVAENSLVVFDRLRQKEFLLMDRPLYQLSSHPEQKNNFVILTHYFHLPDFVATNCANIPIIIKTPVGKKILALFDELVTHRQANNLSEENYLPAILDIYKTAFTEGIIKSIPSPLLPLGQRRENYSNKTIH